MPQLAQADTKVRDAQGNETALPTHRLHMLAAEDGTYPVMLNGWELKVLEIQAARNGFAGWYRNPARATKESLAIAYRESLTGDWKAMRPDFLFFFLTPDGNVAVDLVDPHGHHLADALPKLRGLVDFAEQFENEFRRIESVAETDGTLRVLDLMSSGVRQAVREARTRRRSTNQTSLPITELARSRRMANDMLRIRKARALDDYRVQLTLTNGDVVERDLADLIWGPVFEPLHADYENFRAVYVENGTLAWPNEIDLDPDVLIWNGAPPGDYSARPEAFLRVANQQRLTSAGAH